MGSFYRAQASVREDHPKLPGRFRPALHRAAFRLAHGPRANQYNIIRVYLEQAMRRSASTAMGTGMSCGIHSCAGRAEASVRILTRNSKTSSSSLPARSRARARPADHDPRDPQQEVEIEFGPPERIYHYRVTPYSYRPERRSNWCWTPITTWAWACSTSCTSRRTTAQGNPPDTIEPSK